MFRRAEKPTKIHLLDIQYEAEDLLDNQVEPKVIVTLVAASEQIRLYAIQRAMSHDEQVNILPDEPIV